MTNVKPGQGFTASSMIEDNAEDSPLLRDSFRKAQEVSVCLIV